MKLIYSLIQTKKNEKKRGGSGKVILAESDDNGLYDENPLRIHEGKKGDDPKRRNRKNKKLKFIEFATTYEG